MFTFLYIEIAWEGSFVIPRPRSKHRPRINVDRAIPFRIYWGKQPDARDNSSISSNADTLIKQFFLLNIFTIRISIYLFAKSVALVNNFLV